MVNLASRWSPTDYARNAAFVPALGDEALRLLNPQPGELILDLGCGDGALTQRIVEAGASVIGIDSSQEMVEAARARGIDAFVGDAEAMDLGRFGAFDAVFSNAALHWMLDADAVASGVFKALRPGGRFVGEMGGEGNLLALRGALRDELSMRGYEMPEQDPAWYAGIEEFTRLYCVAGFSEVRAELIGRPTPLPGGVAEWVRTFRAGVMDVAMVPEWERDDIAAAVEARVAPALRRPDGTFCADYVRLRFAMKRPE
ncbi:MAG: methyltransferase domain-containing protein [Alphaproteobacteria bacterium]|nr:MAG: methyltransferase domain-containing protein [Alphaproteobacteria bacterium]